MENSESPLSGIEKREADRIERAAYLDKTYPRPSQRVYHGFGRFTELACTVLAEPIPVAFRRSEQKYILVDAFEPNGNPLREIVRFRFRILDRPEAHRPPSWGGLDRPLNNSTEGLYYSFFDSSETMQENLASLKTFAAESLKDELAFESPVSVAAPEVTATEKSESRRLSWESLIVILIGLIGLVAVAITVLQQAIQLTIALATVAFVAILILGITGGMRANQQRSSVKGLVRRDHENGISSHFEQQRFQRP